MRPRPRPVAVDGGWLTIAHAGPRATPAGYCADHADKPHPTADEAHQCHRKYLVEQTLRLDADMPAPGPCTACGTMTGKTVVINGYPRGPWCDDHRTAEHVGEWWHKPAEVPAATGQDQ